MSFTEKNRFRWPKGYCPVPPMMKSDNPKWKGDKVGYFALHEWMRKNYGNADRCQNLKCKYPRINSRGDKLCRPKRFEWANKGKLNRELKNWIKLCASCHRRYDLGLLIIK